MNVVLVTLLVVVWIAQYECEPTTMDQIREMQVKNEILYRLLRQHCPGFVEDQSPKRELDVPDDHPIHLYIQEKLNDQLMKEWDLCNKRIGATTSPPIATMLPTPPIATTPPTPPIATTPLTPANTCNTLKSSIEPKECQEAICYTETWRLDHRGGNIKPGGDNSDGGYACDMHTDKWFRFEGTAGTYMLDVCPKHRSCGAEIPFWTDEKMPKGLGIEMKVDVYGVTADGDCYGEIKTVKVIRCSWSKENDFIYKVAHTKESSCRSTFCSDF